MTRLMLMVVPAVIAAIVMGCNDRGGSSSAPAETSALDLEKRREWASRLMADGFKDQAVKVYEDILASPGPLSEKLVAGISVTIAEAHIEAGRYAEALRSLYRARLFPLDPELARRIDAHQIFCFEKLGRTASADRLLDKATAPARGGEGADGGDVLAEIGGEKITRADFDLLLAGATPEMKNELQSRERRVEALKGLVARRVFVRRAEKLGLGDEDKVREAMRAAGEEILVRRLLGDEVATRVKVEEHDVRLYYEAHPQKFRTPSELKLAHILVDGEDDEAAVRMALRMGRDFATLAREFSKDEATKEAGGVVAERVVEGKYHPKFVNVSEVFTAAGDTPPGEVAAASARSSKGRHVLKVIERKDGVPMSFEDSKKKAEALLRTEREQAALRQLFEEALNAENVKIHGDRL